MLDDAPGEPRHGSRHRKVQLVVRNGNYAVTKIQKKKNKKKKVGIFYDTIFIFQSVNRKLEATCVFHYLFIFCDDNLALV